MIDLRAYVLDARSYFGKISGYVDGYLARLSCGEVIEINLAQLVVDQSAGAARERVDVRLAGVLDALCHCLRCRIVLVQGHGAATVGEKVDHLADPHRIEVRPCLVRNFYAVEVFQTSNPDGAGAASAIVAPGDVAVVIEAERRAQRRIGNVRAVAGDLSLIRHWQRQHLGKPARSGHLIELRIPAVRLAIGAEHDLFPIGRPSHRGVRRGMIGDTMRHAASGGNGEHIGIAVVLSRKCDGASIRGKHRRGLGSDAHGQSCRPAPFAIHAPQVSCVVEDDLSLAQRGALKQMGFFRRRGSHAYRGRSGEYPRRKDDSRRGNTQDSSPYPIEV